MVWTIARKEATEMLRDGRFRVGAAVVAALLVASLLAGGAHRRAVEADRVAAQAADRAVWLGQGEKNPHSAAHFGLYAFKPAAPLSAADPGVLPYTGTALFMEAHAMGEAAYRPADDDAPAQRLGTLTAAATLQLLVPLLILLLAFPVFAAEREAGTLRQVVSLGVSPGVLGAGKALGVALPVALVGVPAAALGALALAIGGGDVEALRWALWTGLYVVYFALVLAAGLLVSARAPTARAALVVLLGAWVVTGFVVPRLAADVASARHPLPTSSAYDAAVRASVDSLYAAAPDAHAPGAAPSAGEGLHDGERAEMKLFRRHAAALAETHRAQEATTRAAALVSPLLAVQRLSMALAATDAAHHRHFATAAETYRYDYVQTLNGAMIEADMDFDSRAGAETWARVRPFAYAAPGVGWALAPHGGSFAALALWALALGAALARTLRRLRVA